MQRQSRRQGFHDFWMAISDTETADAPPQLISEWAKSHLWIRSCVADVPAMPMKDFIIPDNSMLLAGAGMSKSQRLKQHVSGHELWSRLISKLWEGMPVAAVAQCAGYVNLTPYDLSLIQAVMQYNAQQKAVVPQGKVASVTFAQDDSGHENRSTIQQYLLTSCMRMVQKRVNNKLLDLPGFVKRTFTETRSPTYKEEDFVMTMPLLADGQKPPTLPLRQAWLDTPDAKFNLCLPAFETLVADHNKAFNMSGTPFKGLKRTAPDAEASPAQLLPIQAAAETKDQLPKPLIEISTGSYDLIIDVQKRLWLLAKADTTVTDKRPVMLLWGEYLKDAALQKRTDAGNAVLFPWEMSSEDSKAFWYFENAQWESFAEGLQPLKDFLKHLERYSVVTPAMACHDIKLGSEARKGFV